MFGKEFQEQNKGRVCAKGLPLTVLESCMQTVFDFFLCLIAASPQSSILSRSSSRYDFGDEDAGVIAHVGVVGSSCYAEAEA